MGLRRSTTNLKPDRLHISVFVGSAAILWVVVLLVQGEGVTWAHGKPFSIVVSGVVLLGWVLERWLWRQRLLHGWL